MAADGTGEPLARDQTDTGADEPPSPPGVVTVEATAAGRRGGFAWPLFQCLTVGMVLDTWTEPISPSN